MKHTGILNFKNLTVKYNDSVISKKEILKLETIFNGGLIVLFFLWILSIAVSVLFLYFTTHLILSIAVCFSLGVLILFGGGFLLARILATYSPRHYDFVTGLMRLGTNEIETGWFNNQYLVMVLSQNSWERKSLDGFIDEDYDLTDNADKALPIHMTIDLTTEKVQVLIENK